jgi:imidazolonepropionase
MAATLIINIGKLVGVQDPQNALRGSQLGMLPSLENAWLLIRDERIFDFGSMDSMDKDLSADETVDAGGCLVMPCWCDSHTHIVFAATREEEFIDRINGLSYAEIAARGGGILNSAAKLNKITEHELLARSLERVMDVMRMGTGAIEIKSGYGLTVEAELKMLRVIRRLKEYLPIPVKATFLGAHTFPAAYKNDHAGYIRLITDEMIPAIAKEGLADFIDVFCEKGFFTNEETLTICNAGIAHGMVPKVHANQLSPSGAVETGVSAHAISVDHLEVMDKTAIKALAASPTIGTMLPGAAFFLGSVYPPAREMINANCALALASDYNPGSSPSGNMNFVVSLACIQMHMTPEEAVNASTINGAFAMGIQQDAGSIVKGKLANLLILNRDAAVSTIPYSFGHNPIAKVIIRGKSL